jgi:cellulose synthase/poly-beta-1,6-N-acetylglucosamine synthase-like glycosyltransferase
MDESLAVFQTILSIITLYYISISIFSLYKKHEEYLDPPTKSFAIVIAAHNEEKVIGELLKNIWLLEYPKELYEVFVIADNCTDNTAKIARSLNATVFERRDNNQKGKGYALEYGFKKIFYLPRKFDAVLVVDADNLISSNFLTVMNCHLNRGEKIIQGYLDTKNPDDTWISRSIGVGYIITNRFWQLAKYNLGLSCALGGTGMCIESSVLKKFGWGMTSLTEDLEFQTKALLCNLRVSWTHDAIIYDEKPLTLKQSWRQRQRWMQGHCSVANQYFLKLFWTGIVNKNFKMIDGAIYLLQPYYTMGLGLALVLSYLIHPGLLSFYWFGVTFVIQYLYLGVALLLEKAPVKAFFWLLYYPFFTLTWIPVAFTGFIYRNQKNWNHTQHVRNISYEILKKQTQP